MREVELFMPLAVTHLWDQSSTIWTFPLLLITTCHSSFPLLDKDVSGTVGPSTDVTNSFMKLFLVVGFLLLETSVWGGFWLTEDCTPEAFFGQEGTKWPTWPHFQQIGFLLVAKISSVHPLSIQMRMELNASHVAAPFPRLVVRGDWLFHHTVWNKQLVPPLS